MRVLLDADLAHLYGVPTKALNQAVKRNLSRFPDDFVFKLSADEVEQLNRSQIVTGSQKHRHLPPFRPLGPFRPFRSEISNPQISNSGRAGSPNWPPLNPQPSTFSPLLD